MDPGSMILRLSDGKLQMTEISLIPTLTIAKEEDREKANRILLKTEQVCLITNSIKSKVIMNPVIKITTESTVTESKTY